VRFGLWVNKIKTKYKEMRQENREEKVEELEIEGNGVYIGSKE
jgi:hypothetical protein